ncbi:MAG: acyl-CoA dehydrogenase C-terminal domain-containing protein [Burkholderiaceae bacterium]|nr:acyl-CoA dehydrogenase C-terminal domain-containing protein [Burkholderiaceae bacterium]
MFRYATPLRDMRFVLHELLDAHACLARANPQTVWDRETIDRTIEAAGQFAARELAPLNASGDEQGCSLAAGSVVTPEGFALAYRRFVDAGWPTLACAEELGGQGAPSVVFSAMLETLYAANPGWTMYFGTARGAYECLQAHASAQQKAYYLPRVVSGEWATTMCLTEAHCGSDLGLLRTRATPQPDGSHRITGSKLFISGGDQDLTPNIVHLVLARLPNAPPGVGGISLFIVPKHLPQGEGLARASNGMTATAVEHKMGLRGSATCAMSFDNATGWLVGRENEGLRNMFVMINSSRIGVAVQAVGIGHAAYCSALEYARERLQMRAARGAARPDLAADPIIEHADVRRMLLTQKANVEAARMLVYWLSLLCDQQAQDPDQSARREATDLVGLLTPVAKAFLTENAFAAASLAIQIHGGHGYIRDHGVEQIARDIRIAQIYEGTNGIQGRDLLARKILADGGAKLDAFLDRVRRDVASEPIAAAAGFGAPLSSLCDEIRSSLEQIGEAARADAPPIGAAAWDFLRALGHLCCGWLYMRAAAIAQERIDQGSPDAFYPSKLATARFYFARLLPEARMHLAAARSGRTSLSELAQDQLFV